MLKKTIYIKKLFFTAVAVLFLTAVGMAFTAVAAIYRPYDTHTSSQQSSDQDPQSGGYLIKDLDGFITIFDEYGNIVRITDLQTKTLPATDRELLKNGITVSDREELYEVLSDYDA